MLDPFKAQELELKRIETVGKFIDAATERQFKLASFSLAGNVGAIAASSVALKDFRPKIEDKNHQFSEATFLFLFGAVASAVSLALVLVASELFSYVVGSVVANGPTKEHADSQMFSKIAHSYTQGVGVLIFIVLYGMSAWCFFSGLYSILGFLQ